MHRRCPVRTFRLPIGHGTVDLMSYVVAVGPALVVGFVAGLFAFRQKSRWCPTCGATFTCPDRNRHADTAPGPANRGSHFPGEG